MVLQARFFKSTKRVIYLYLNLSYLEYRKFRCHILLSKISLTNVSDVEGFSAAWEVKLNQAGSSSKSSQSHKNILNLDSNI